jgi:ATP-dependent RNA helicase DDX51/DBP6
MYARYIPPPKPKAAPAAPANGSFSYSRYVPASEAPSKDISEQNASLTFRFEEVSPPTAKAEVGESKKEKKKKRRREEGGHRHGEMDENSKKRRKGAGEVGPERDREERSGDWKEKDRPEQTEEGMGEKTEGEKKRKKRKKAPVDGEHDRETEAKPNPKRIADEREGAKVDRVQEDDQLKGPSQNPEALKHETKEEQKGGEKRKQKQDRQDDGQGGGESDDAPSQHRAILEKKERALRISLARPKTEGDEEAGNGGKRAESPGPAHGLQPLPQPEPLSFDVSKPSLEALPAWVSNPIRVQDNVRASFADLGIPDKDAQVLAKKGFPEAFAIQAAAIPLLLPTARRVQGDVLISAATGSGKTLAYAIPIIRDISQGLVTRLRAVVVLPTRELTKQAKEVFEFCSSAFYVRDKRKKVKIGIAYGSQSLKHEQDTLISRAVEYNPDAIKKLDAIAWDDESSESERLCKKYVRAHLPGHVVEFGSAVDVLICTPGRLVDHIQQTQGFSMTYVRWLVMDEGDKLLEQDYQGWTDIVQERLRLDDKSDPVLGLERIIGARDHLNSNYAGVRKIIVSATLTKQGCLTAAKELRLQRPSLVILGGEGGEHVLPSSLKEATLTIRSQDEDLKPLYLHDLLMSHHLQSKSGGDLPGPLAYTTLVFTKSNESALRLSRLMVLLDPSLAPLIGTLTSATRPGVRRETMAAFANHRLRLLIASDLVARGIDLPNLDHVINYDLPASVQAYVHRVGRTARAGRAGCAWTLLTGGKGSGWFWGEVVKGEKIVRSHPVTRISLGGEGVISREKRERYERALEELGREATSW